MEFIIPILSLVAAICSLLFLKESVKSNAQMRRQLGTTTNINKNGTISFSDLQKGIDAAISSEEIKFSDHSIIPSFYEIHLTNELYESIFQKGLTNILIKELKNHIIKYQDNHNIRQNSQLEVIFVSDTRLSEGSVLTVAKYKASEVPSEANAA